MENLTQATFKEKVFNFETNTEEQQELSSVFGIQSIPTMLFIPVTGKPQLVRGALPKEHLENAIAQVLGVV